jgi:hypothetical protein
MSGVKALTLFAVLLSPMIVSSCATPFGGSSTRIDWEAPPRAGTITVSDPKMYRRESLIDERRKDLEWIDGLIDGSKTVPFKPEILREIETVSAVSAALGLKFDPASALSYNRSNGTGELQQQIDVMKLQLQLDQLKRDADLVRAKFESQTDPVNADLGKVPADGSAAAATTGISAADQLKAAIERLNAATYDFTKVAKGAPTAGSFISPLDDFRDRQAYRDTLKAARNAASLDELHDLRGSALLRLNFQATAIPDANKSSAPGVVQMQIVGPKPGSALNSRFYRGWLDYINRRINVKVGGKRKPDLQSLQGAVTENFETVYYLYTPKPRVAATAACHGFVSASEVVSKPQCGSLVFVAPQLSNLLPGGKAFQPFTQGVVDLLKPKDDVAIQNDLDARGWTLSVGSNLVRDCKFVEAPKSVLGPNGKPDTPDAYWLQGSLRNARMDLVVGDYYIGLDRLAREILKTDDIEPDVDPDLDKVRERTARASLLSETFVSTVMPVRSEDDRCNVAARASFDEKDPVIFLRPSAKEALWGNQARVAIYEIGPREQAQQMSTVARSANSLGLALSIAAAAPGSGMAADFAGSYSRQAMGRAEALERLPTVVGYSVGGARTFGWVLGPKATVNPDGKINLEQGLRTYDLTVDLSVPGWWPEFELRTLTAWAPKRGEIVEGDIKSTEVIDSDGTKSTGIIAARTIKVPMLPNDADYSVLASILGSTGFEHRREVDLQSDDTFPLQTVSACKASTIVLKGALLWRATTVIVGGVKINGSAIAVLPDMSGIMVDVPALDGKFIGADTKIRLVILTPYGVSSVDALYEGAGDGCKKEDKKPDPNAPTIADYNPKAFQLPGLVTLNVTGKQLDKVTKVTFGDIKGTVTDRTAESIDLSFPKDETSVLPPSMAVIVSFYYLDSNKKEQKIDKLVAITANRGSK